MRNSVSKICGPIQVRAGLGDERRRGKLKVTRNEEDYHLLARRFGLYKKARAEALGGIRYEPVQDEAPDRSIGWKKVRKRVLEKRENAGYSSETEERQYSDRKGGKGKMARQERPKGKPNPSGKDELWGAKTILNKLANVF